jgi:anti-sigma B factor antagonist
MRRRAWLPKGGIEVLDPDQLTIDTTAIADGWVLKVGGELDLATAPALAARLRELDDAGSKRLVVDLRALEFMDCSGLRVLVAARTRARRRDGRFEVACGQDQVQRLLKLTGADLVLELSVAPGAPVDVAA